MCNLHVDEKMDTYRSLILWNQQYWAEESSDELEEVLTQQKQIIFANLLLFASDIVIEAIEAWWSNSLSDDLFKVVLLEMRRETHPETLISEKELTSLAFCYL